MLYLYKNRSGFVYKDTVFDKSLTHTYKPTQEENDPTVEIQLCYPIPITVAPRYRSKRFVDLLQRLHLKIGLPATGQPISLMYPEEVSSIALQLLLLQVKMFYAPAFKPPGWSYLHEITDLMGLITDNMRQFPLWGQFHIVQCF